jgi:hypothetical protein
METGDTLTEERIAELRRMTPQEKLEIMTRMYWDARRAEGLRVQTEHPDWSEAQVHAEVSRRFLARAMKEE